MGVRNLPHHPPTLWHLSVNPRAHKNCPSLWTAYFLDLFCKLTASLGYFIPSSTPVQTQCHLYPGGFHRPLLLSPTALLSSPLSLLKRTFYFCRVIPEAGPTGQPPCLTVVTWVLYLEAEQFSPCLRSAQGWANLCTIGCA